MKKELKDFIKHNEFTFTEGVRNTELTALIGFALYKGANEEEIIEAIGDKKFTGELNNMFDSVWNCARNNDYGAWWKINNKLAHERYIFKD